MVNSRPGPLCRAGQARAEEEGRSEGTRKGTAAMPRELTLRPYLSCVVVKVKSKPFCCASGTAASIPPPPSPTPRVCEPNALKLIDARGTVLGIPRLAALG